MKPYKYICSYTKDNIFYSFYLSSNGLMLCRDTKSSHSDFSNTDNFTQKDLDASIEYFTVYYEGYDIVPDCKECKFRFKCWSGNYESRV